MKQREAKEKPSLKVLRKTQVSHSPGGHGGEGSWAVSYADLLMVLLSFFVMFFTFKEQNPDTVEAEIVKVARAMQGTPIEKRTPQPENEDDEKQDIADQKEGIPLHEDKTNDPNASPDPNKMMITNAEIKKLPEDDGKLLEISKALQIQGVRVANDKSQLIVTMDNSAFEPASYLLSAELQRRINDVLRQLSPFKENIQITVVGHADRTTLLKKTDLMQDNFDLSSIRALRVLKYLVGRGFPENRASARASSFFDRDARSISLVIQPAPKVAKKEGS